MCGKLVKRSWCHFGERATLLEVSRYDVMYVGSGSPRTCIPRFRCQNMQSAAPPAMVPKRKGLISITFFTV